MKNFLLLLFIALGCAPTVSQTSAPLIECNEKGCAGTYRGPEFVNGSDVAHQFSNKMSAVVGDKLKERYRSGDFCKVDFPNIKMTTEGMGTGTVEYYLSIPFADVATECEAYTSLDHSGGWNHRPALTSRKKELEKALIEGETLDISSLKQTQEGLQEYWIQWKNKGIQKRCE